MTKQVGDVSVIIPTRNRKEELLRALESVRAQSVVPKEIIVVDDMSEFSVEELLRDHCDQEITVIRNSIRLGASESRNLGAMRAKSEFLAFLDSDDYWAPTKLEKQLSVFQERRELGLVYCDLWRVDGNGNHSESGKVLLDSNLFEHLVEGWIAPNTSTLVFRRDIFLELGGFDKELSSCQDHDVWMRVAERCIPVGFCSERLAYFSSGSSVRITRDYLHRLGGMERFLSKWKGAIEERFGRVAFKKFASDYVTKVAYPLLVICVRERQLARAAKIVAKYLFMRKGFYGRLAGLWHRRLRVS